MDVFRLDALKNSANMSVQFYVKTIVFFVVVVIVFHKMEPRIQKVPKAVLDTSIFS